MLTDTAETMRLRCIAQLYDDWHGYYVLRHLFMGQWLDVRALTRDEAVTRRKLAEDEALLIVLNDHVSNPER